MIWIVLAVAIALMFFGARSQKNGDSVVGVLMMCLGLAVLFTAAMLHHHPVPPPGEEPYTPSN